MFPTCLIALFVLAALLPFSESKHDFYLHFIEPSFDTLWYKGDNYLVQWEVIGSLPRKGTNPKGDLYLAKDNQTLFQYHLATNFNLTDGQVSVSVPPQVDAGIYWVIAIGERRALGHSLEFSILDM